MELLKQNKHFMIMYSRLCNLYYQITLANLLSNLFYNVLQKHVHFFFLLGGGMSGFRLMMN